MNRAKYLYGRMDIKIKMWQRHSVFCWQKKNKIKRKTIEFHFTLLYLFHLREEKIDVVGSINFLFIYLSQLSVYPRVQIVTISFSIVCTKSHTLSILILTPDDL